MEFPSTFIRPAEAHETPGLGLCWSDQTDRALLLFAVSQFLPQVSEDSSSPWIKTDVGAQIRILQLENSLLIR